MASKTALVDRPNIFGDTDIPKGISKIYSTTDSRVPNCTNFTIHMEDHTLGHLLCCQLLKDPAVLFAAYHMPHPLENKVEIRIQASDCSTPYTALYNAIVQRQNETCCLLKNFSKKIAES